MYNFLDTIIAEPGRIRQVRNGDKLIAEFTCPLNTAQQDMWSHASYFVYVLEGRKDWRSAEGKVQLHAGDLAFVKKGASLVDQYLSTPFCVLLFFITDEFICEVFRTIEVGVKNEAPVAPLAKLGVSPAMEGYMHSMLPHFRTERTMDPALLDLKLRELLLNIAGEAGNHGFVAAFQAMMKGNALDRFRRTMEDNYCFNLSLEAYARLCGRSLSAFKRDFQDVFGMAPGRWLREQRLQRAKLLLGGGDLQVSEVAFQCGFENLSHFSRAFKEAYGHSPAHLRKVEG
ncbi:MAG TPA: AraC family transcriptional regulator [Flavobacteriales bacterium]|jgi:AraC-like DNA-binding protein|nr:AraC family transcriptional regulator [Flavobacteriales bacterium]